MVARAPITRPTTISVKLVPTIRHVILAEWRKMAPAVMEYRPLTDQKSGAPTSRAVRHVLRLLVPEAGQAVSERGSVLSDTELDGLRAEFAAARPVIERTVLWHREAHLAYRARRSTSSIRPFRDSTASLLELSVGWAQAHPEQLDQASRQALISATLDTVFADPEMNVAIRDALSSVEVRRRVQSTLDEAWSVSPSDPLGVERALTHTPYGLAMTVLEGAFARPQAHLTPAAENAWQALLEQWTTLPELRAKELFLTVAHTPPKPSLRTMRGAHVDDAREGAPTPPLDMTIEARLLKATHRSQAPIAQDWTAEGLLHAEAEASAQRGGVRSPGAQVAVLIAGVLARAVMATEHDPARGEAPPTRSALGEAYAQGRRSRRALEALSGPSTASRALALITYEPGAYLMYRSWVRIHQTTYRDGESYQPSEYWAEICAALGSSTKEVRRLLKSSPSRSLNELRDDSADEPPTGLGHDMTLELLQRFALQQWGHDGLREFAAWCFSSDAALTSVERRDQWEMLCAVAVDTVARLIERGDIDGLPSLTVNDLPTLHQIRLHIRDGGWVSLFDEADGGERENE